MPDAIRTSGLGKRYRVGTPEPYGMLRDWIAEQVRGSLTVLRRRERDRRRDGAWAIRDIDLTVAEGEVIGIVGRNGSGKSTLLKVLSRITEPTSGWADVRGRVGALLEVGTGFHPELTGRENVQVGGAILGMRRAEIARRFDEIVAFADIGGFIDAPVKQYSSGMQMRLAFSVAAHLQPDILLVDEVLAVGDVAFQRKCLGKMDEVGRAGRTILFVSHQLNQIRRLCGRCVWLDGGRVVVIGPTVDVLTQYESALGVGRFNDDATLTPDGTRFIGWDLDRAPEPMTGHVLDTMGPCRLRVWMTVREPIRNGDHGIALHDSEGHLIWGAGLGHLRLEPGRHAFTYRFASLPVRPGAYRWRVTLHDDGNQVDDRYLMPQMTVATMPTGHRHDERAGVLNLEFDLSVSQDPASRPTLIEA